MLGFLKPAILLGLKRMLKTLGMACAGSNAAYEHIKKT
jgi:hypothetical protein